MLLPISRYEVTNQLEYRIWLASVLSLVTFVLSLSVSFRSYLYLAWQDCSHCWVETTWHAFFSNSSASVLNNSIYLAPRPGMTSFGGQFSNKCYKVLRALAFTTNKLGSVTIYHFLPLLLKITAVLVVDFLGLVYWNEGDPHTYATSLQPLSWPIPPKREREQVHDDHTFGRCLGSGGNLHCTFSGCPSNGWGHLGLEQLVYSRFNLLG